MAEPEDMKVFESIDVGGVRIPNRFMRSATHEWMCDEDGTPGPDLGGLLSGLARGEVGLITTGYAYVHPQGRSMARQNAMHEDRLVEHYSRITSRVNEDGSRIFMQLVHGGRQAWKGEEEFGRTVAPSSVPDPENEERPKEMSDGEILATVRDFVEAARRAREAGFDGVQLHAAHGFLLSSFMSPHTNRRDDRWGGPLENRARIIIEILRGIRREVGPAFPVMAKMNATDGFEEEGKGLQLEDSVDMAKILAAEGLAAVEVSDGIYEAGATSSRKGVTRPDQEGYFLDHARTFRAELDIPVICVGGLRSLEVMEEAVSGGMCDMVSLSRPLIREPDLVRRFRTGASVRAECISCNKCFDETGIRCNAEK